MDDVLSLPNTKLQEWIDYFNIYYGDRETPETKKITPISKTESMDKLNAIIREKNGNQT